MRRKKVKFVNSDFPRPLIGFVSFSGTGKTTLLEQLIPLLRERGIRIALLKHAHHEFDIDTPGKDSYRLRKAGASQTMIASAKRWALITENQTEQNDPQLEELLKQLDPQQFDLLLVEGFKYEPYPKIELHREALGKPLLYPDDPHIIAIACDTLQPQADIPVLNINQPEAIRDYIINWLNHTASNANILAHHIE